MMKYLNLKTHETGKNIIVGNDGFYFPQTWIPAKWLVIKKDSRTMILLFRPSLCG